jgi:hypothetical protein
MRILLDACVPRRLRDSLTGHEVRTAPEMGWGDLNNGALLDAMAGKFDALVTVDNLSDLLPLVPALLSALADLKPGVVDEIAG